MIETDYIGTGCPAIGATDAVDVTVANLVLDTQRLPFTDAVVNIRAWMGNLSYLRH